MAENESVVKVGGPYKESDTHVPNPTDIYRQLNTSGTGSVTDIRDVTPIFDIAAKGAHLQAAAALDPKDDTVDRSTVILPDNDRENDEVKKEIGARAKAAKEPVVVGSGYKGPSARAAEDKTGDEGKRAAVSEQREQGAPGGATSGSKADTKADGTTKA